MMLAVLLEKRAVRNMREIHVMSQTKILLLHVQISQTKITA